MSDATNLDLITGHLDANGDIKWRTVCCGAEVKKPASRFEVIIDNADFYNYQVYDIVKKMIVSPNATGYEIKAEAEAVAERLNSI